VSNRSGRPQKGNDDVLDYISIDERCVRDAVSAINERL